MPGTKKVLSKYLVTYTCFKPHSYYAKGSNKKGEKLILGFALAIGKAGLT